MNIMIQIPEGATQVYAPYIAHGGIAFFGAIVHAAKAYRSDESKTWVDHILLTIMSSFSGVMFAIVGFHFFGVDSYISLAMAGTGGYVGVEGMTWIIRILQDKLGITIK